MTRIAITSALFLLLVSISLDAQEVQPGTEEAPPNKVPPAESYSLEEDDASASGTDSPRPVEPSALGLLLKVGLTLALLIGALLGVAYLFRRFGPGGIGLLRPSGPIRILARSSLPPKHILYLIHVGDRILLVGSSGDHLITLTEISDPEEMTRLEKAALGDRADGIPGEFRSVISEAMKEYEEEPVPDKSPPIPKSLRDV